VPGVCVGYRGWGAATSSMDGTGLAGGAAGVQKANGSGLVVLGGVRCPVLSQGLAACAGQATSGKWGCLCHRRAPSMLSWLFNDSCSM